MNISSLFIRRPIGTSLLAVGMVMLGFAAYRLLPVASLPNVDIPTIVVLASQPGANPETMAATIAAPLERTLGAIAGIEEITSISSLGSARIILQFDMSRKVVAAARDVQAALNAAATDLPTDLPTLPRLLKINPNAEPILSLALTSPTMSSSDVYDVADSILAQRMAQVEGVAQVQVSGADQPAIRVRIDPERLAAIGISTEQVRSALVNANALTPLGQLVGENLSFSIQADGQMLKPEEYRSLVVASVNGEPVLLSQVADVMLGVRTSRSSATYNGQPAVLLFVTKQADANVVTVVDDLKALLPHLRGFIPAGIEISIVTDRTALIRASIDDMGVTLMISIALVMAVVFVFLRHWPATLAAGVTVPLALAGTVALMLEAGFSLDNLSLMALAVAVGFVVDDAIVVIEMIESRLAFGLSPMKAAEIGTKLIGFTVVSISLSLFAAFIPLLFMGGIIGKFFREFAMTLGFAILISTLVSLTVTPMICAHFLRYDQGHENFFDRFVEFVLNGMTKVYIASLDVVLRFRFLTIATVFAAVVMTVGLFKNASFALLPTVETGLIIGTVQGPTEISFPAMNAFQNKVVKQLAGDPAIQGISSTLDSGGFGSSINSGRLFISLKPPEQRDHLSVTEVLDRLRKRTLGLVEGQVYLQTGNDIRAGARASKATYQFTLWDADYQELIANVPKLLAALKALPDLTDVASDREANGLQANIVIDRQAAMRLGVSIASIDATLNNSYSQRQISTLYNVRNQYRVVMEVAPKDAHSPLDIPKLYVPGAGGKAVPLESVAHIEQSLSPLVVNHQGQFPSVTLSYSLPSGASQSAAITSILQTVGALHLPDGLHAEFAGDARKLAGSVWDFGILIVTAIAAVYIVLGVLYESLVHPLTIISTLPTACLGALLALRITHTDLSIISLIGLILLIGIVKKNGIMLVDFALHAERERGMTPAEAIRSACIERFRPILMTTLASLLGAMPMIFTQGPAFELRYPLGVTIAGGLVLSQLLTLYTTPVIYLALDRLGKLPGRLNSFFRARLGYVKIT